jgi:hypothetical protein
MIQETIEKIKKIPLGVKIAMLFLLAMFVWLCVALPWAGIGLAISIGVLAAISRIMGYFQSGY